jgi:ketosteroid isomerase-like protein
MIGAMMLRMAMNSGTGEMNSRDVNRLLKNWTEDAVLIYPGNMPFSGEIKGKPMLRAFFEIYYDQFPTMNFERENAFISNLGALGLTNVVAMEVKVNYTNKFGKAFENSVMSCLKIKRGKVWYDKDYYHDVDLLEEAWEGADLTKLDPFLGDCQRT